MIKKTFLILLFSISTQNILSQVSNRVSELSKKLETIHCAESSIIGVAGKPSIIYSNYRKIDSIATNKELFHFAKNGSNSLRFYSLKSLVNRKDIEKVIWLYQFYSKYPMKVVYQSGCEVQTISLTGVIKQELRLIQKIIGENRLDIIDKQITYYKKELLEENITKRKKLYYNGFIKDLYKEKESLKTLAKWSQKELSTIIDKLESIDKTER
ncbi:hypothetical protein [Tenacibaculum sp. M341]|uniref:hypothetical protein n=1 Tax=Tenacibaculum sp. M341 TaxID=2530339 RepID=UPI0010518C31|nr:hypothetical protein [Tenacibaculum sp. M341]TCI90604.1 hypothetical protein EYW44_12820 [Tenacibaculum sp. M341]